MSGKAWVLLQGIAWLFFADKAATAYPRFVQICAFFVSFKNGEWHPRCTGRPWVSNLDLLLQKHSFQKNSRRNGPIRKRVCLSRIRNDPTSLCFEFDADDDDGDDVVDDNTPAEFS